MMGALGTVWKALLSTPLTERAMSASVELLVVVAFVFFVTRIIRIRSKRLVAVLWMIALLKPLVGLSFGTPTSIPLPMPSVLAPSPVEQLIRVEIEQSDTAAPGRRVFVASPEACAAPVAAGVQRPWRKVLLAAWVAGVVVLLSRSIVQRLLLIKLKRAARRPASAVLDIYRRVVAEAGKSRSPQLLVTDAIETPALAGTLRPVVLLPAWMEAEGNADRIEWSLRHELTHWLHRDHWGNALREGISILFFFHPAAWFAGKQWKEAAEVACDEAVVRARGGAREYAEQLYQILARIHNRRRPAVACALFATRTQIGRRIELLLRNAPGKRNRTALAASALLFGAASLAVGADVSFKPDPTNIALDDQVWVQGDDRDHTINIHEIGDNGEVRIRARGNIEFSDDYDILTLGDGAYVRVEERSEGKKTSVKVTTGDDGQLQYHYRVNRSDQPFDDEARQWLKGVLEKYLGQTKVYHLRRNRLI